MKIICTLVTIAILIGLLSILGIPFQFKRAKYILKSSVYNRSSMNTSLYWNNSDGDFVRRDVVLKTTHKVDSHSNIIFHNMSIHLLQTDVIISGHLSHCHNHAIAVGVLSSAKNVDRRNAIRKTWGRNHCVVFIVGFEISINGYNGKIHKEARQFSDMIILAKREKYSGTESSIPFKTAAWFYIVFHNMSYIRIVLKTDDDSYVKVNLVHKEIASLNSSYWGRMLTGAPVRDPTHKNYMSRSMFPSTQLPEYCSGAGYALSYNAVKCYVQRVTDTKFVSNEDVLTGLIMEACGIVITRSNSVFSSKPDKYWTILHYIDVLKIHSTLSTRDT